MYKPKIKTCISFTSIREFDMRFNAVLATHHSAVFIRVILESTNVRDLSVRVNIKLNLRGIFCIKRKNLRRSVHLLPLPHQCQHIHRNNTLSVPKWKEFQFHLKNDFYLFVLRRLIQFDDWIIPTHEIHKNWAFVNVSTKYNIKSERYHI